MSTTLVNAQIKGGLRQEADLKIQTSKSEADKRLCSIWF